MAKINRRHALISGVGLSVSGCATSGDTAQQSGSFKHSVASGDPSNDGAVIWTRISGIVGAHRVRWEVSDLQDFSRIAKTGAAKTSAARDYTVKVMLKGLAAGQTYFYRFISGETVSRTGRLKTLPNGAVDQLRLAVVSCSNYPFGYFNAYEHIAKNDAFDAVIHLGDYFYEYGQKGYGGETGAQLGRQHEPAHEVLSLDDYRARHAQYKSAPGAQAVHAAHSFICIWDDHESANDSWAGGAENHNDGEGDWDTRRAAALRAYYEWMPVRDPARGRPREALFRHYDFGDLASITAIETRLTARSKQIDYSAHEKLLSSPGGADAFRKDIIGDSDRELLGPAQSKFIARHLRRSARNGQSWQLIANQVIMAKVNMPDMTAMADHPDMRKLIAAQPWVAGMLALSRLGLPLNLDAWDGYPAARERLYDMARSAGAPNIIVLTGDTHESWANALTDDSGNTVGAELATPGVTSPSTGAYFGKLAQTFSKSLAAKNDDIHYHANDYNGYIDVLVRPKEIRGRFIAVNTVLSPNYSARTARDVKVQRSANGITLAS